MSEKIRKKLSPEDMKIIENAAIESWDYQKKLWAESDAEALAKLKKAGVTVTYPRADEQQQFIDACAPLVKTYKNGKYETLINKMKAVK